MFNIRNWPTYSDMAKNALDTIKETHNVVPIPAYDLSGHLIKPQAYHAKLEGALCYAVLQNSVLLAMDSCVPPLLRAYASLFVVSVATIIVSSLATYRIIPGMSPDGLMFW
ncbi:hypothetical protein F5141DRAFT_1224490 [Pisolithus sp. B1]|nr:hypothetical protein F5141DRAFT_1224490 [Pisolithus sp. B1]